MNDEPLSAVEQVRYFSNRQIVDEWANIGTDLLRRATGVEWFSRVVIDLWDAEITFIHEDIKHMTQSLSMQDTPENNFTLVLTTIMSTLYYWRKR